MTSKIIMLTGNMGCGKTTAAKILALQGFKEETFAEPLKDFALLLGFTYDQVYGTQEEKMQVNEFYGVSGREFLQKFGTDVCRKYLQKAIPNMKLNGKTLWARVMEKKMVDAKRLVISDGRFLDEAELVKNHGGIIIRLNRNVETDNKVEGDCCEKHTVCKFKPAIGVQSHASEVELNKIKADYVVDNNGSFTDLESTLVGILKREGVTTFSKPFYSMWPDGNTLSVVMMTLFMVVVALGIKLVSLLF